MVTRPDYSVQPDLIPQAFRDRWKGGEKPRDPERSLRSKKLRKPASKAAIWDRSHGHCWYCGVVMNPFRDFTIDHLVPYFIGGGDELENLVPCCRFCNSRKKDRDLEKFRDLIERASLSPTSFTAAQRAYLASNGIELPDEGRYRFWFEMQS